MKKQMIQLAVLLVLLAGAASAFLLLRRDDGNIAESSPDKEQAYVLGGIPQPFVKKVDIQNEVDTFSIENDALNAIQQQNADTTFSIPGLATDTLNQTILKSLMNTAANLSATKMISEGGADFSVYGLSSPAATMTVTYENGSATLLVGNEAPGSEGTYVAVEDAVYLVDTSKLAYLYGSRLSFVSKTITPGSADTSQPEKITLSGGKYPDPISIEKAVDTEAAGSYQITTPIRTGVDASAGLTPLKQSVYGLSASAVVDIAGFRDEKSAAYGLAEPYLLAEVRTLNESGDPAGEIPSFSVAFSMPDADGLVYVQCNTSAYVYQMSASSLPFLGLGLFDYQQKLVLTPRIDTLSEIEITVGDEVHTFRLEGEGSGLVVITDDLILDTANFRKFYQTLIAARYDAEIPPDKATGTQENEAGDPDTEDVSPGMELAEDVQSENASSDVLLQYTYRYRDGTPDSIVRFMAGSARRSLVSLDGGRAYYIQSVYVDRVLADLPKVMADEEVQAY